MRAIVEVAAILAAAVVMSSTATVFAQERDPRPARGERLFTIQGCYGCHQVEKYGTPIGPDLSRLGSKYSATYLRRWLHDPEGVRPAAHMPKLELTAEDIELLAAYLSSLK